VNGEHGVGPAGVGVDVMEALQSLDVIQFPFPSGQSDAYDVNPIQFREHFRDFSLGTCTHSVLVRTAVCRHFFSRVRLSDSFKESLGSKLRAQGRAYIIIPVLYFPLDLWC